ncbi:hypothetical protein [Salinarimonas soli]|uniref:Xylose isomerase-like TIM barrel domain-containing protein n=1 Tax=Salinarimonas soli TaxID=1638099 RepID=A0A5B2VWQ4_9HYPH|nr:hypothetical protein [Salinarimonas soli]KAA2244263.1 hypothetical protein F0L46_01050 [Salinarimonas soli]
MPSFALKGALIDVAQLDARAAGLARMGLPVRLELHTFGARDIDTPEGQRAARAVVARLKDYHPVESLVVHVPVQSVPVVTSQAFDVGQCERTIAFAQDIGAGGVVLHRYYGLVLGDAPARIRDRSEATAAFNAIVRALALAAGPVRLLVENIGHYWILPGGERDFLSGPLDHFFPWEIAAFRAFLSGEQIHNVEPFVDVAHATLTANLFNRRKRRPDRTAGDPRFAWITDEDLERADRLGPLDFVDPAMTYLHVSDALRLTDAQCQQDDLSAAELRRGITSEGLELGQGNIPIRDLPAHVGGSATLVLEVDPGPGESHVANGAQLRSLAALTACFT